MPPDLASDYELAPGAAFAGYTIIEPLGRGGVGEVYLAQHPRLPRRVALKILRVTHRDDAEFRRRFVREADLVSRLEHPGIVDVYDRGETADRMWLAMRHVTGDDASHLVRRRGRLRAPDVSRIVSDVATALDFAHGQGVIHRDVKPGNILLEPTADGCRALIADFGIAFPTDAATRITSTEHLVGSIEYTAPERLTNSEVDARADQYSLACTAYHLLVGELPFDRDDLSDAVIAHLADPVPSACARVKSLHWLVDQVLARALSKNREDRYDSCGEFAADLAAALTMAPDRSGVHGSESPVDDMPIPRMPPSQATTRRIPTPSPPDIGSPDSGSPDIRSSDVRSTMIDRDLGALTAAEIDAGPGPVVDPSSTRIRIAIAVIVLTLLAFLILALLS